MKGKCAQKCNYLLKWWVEELLGDWQEKFIYWSTSGGLEIIKQQLVAVYWAVGRRCNGWDVIFGWT